MICSRNLNDDMYVPNEEHVPRSCLVFQGAIIFHFLASIYIFIAIAIVVDDYFIAALDKLCSVCL